MRHPAAGGQLADLARIDRGLGSEVKAVEVARCGEVRDLAGHLDPPLVLAGNLALAQERQRLAQRQFLSGGFVQQAIQLVADRGEL